MVLQSHNASKILHELTLKTSQRENRPLGKDVTLTGSGISSIYEGLRKQPEARFKKKNVQRYENKQVLYFLKTKLRHVVFLLRLRTLFATIVCRDMEEREPLFVTQRCPD